MAIFNSYLSLTYLDLHKSDDSGPCQEGCHHQVMEPGTIRIWSKRSRPQTPRREPWPKKHLGQREPCAMWQIENGTLRQTKIAHICTNMEHVWFPEEENLFKQLSFHVSSMSMSGTTEHDSALASDRAAIHPMSPKLNVDHNLMPSIQQPAYIHVLRKVP